MQSLYYPVLAVQFKQVILAYSRQVNIFFEQTAQSATFTS